MFNAKSLFKNKYLKIGTPFILGGIFLLAFILRLYNQTKFNIYPDSYRYLMISKSLIDGNRLQLLLSDGSSFWEANFYNFHKLGYSLLTSLLTLFTSDLLRSAHLLSALSGALLSILAFFLLTQLGISKRTALIVSFFVAISGTNIKWSSFVMADSLASASTLCLITCTLLLSRYYGKLKSTRSRYALLLLLSLLLGFSLVFNLNNILLLPLLWIIFMHSQGTKKTIFHPLLPELLIFLCFSLAATIAVYVPVFNLIHPYHKNVLSSLIQHNTTLIVLSILATFAFTGFYMFLASLNSYNEKDILTKVFNLGSVVISCLLVFFSQFLIQNAFLDFFLISTSIIGLVCSMTKQEEQKPFVIGKLTALWILFAFALLGFWINPKMTRYFQMLLPAFIIVSAYALDSIITPFIQRLLSISKITGSILILIIITSGIFLQLHSVAISKGLPIDYEQFVAQEIKDQLQDTKQPNEIRDSTLYITSNFEPYYFYLSQNTLPLKTNDEYHEYSDTVRNPSVLQNFSYIAFIVDEGTRTQNTSFAEWIREEEQLAFYKLLVEVENIPYKHEDTTYFTEKEVAVIFFEIDS